MRWLLVPRGPPGTPVCGVYTVPMYPVCRSKYLPFRDTTACDLDAALGRAPARMACLHGRSWHHPDGRWTHLRCQQQRWPAAEVLQRRRVQPVFSQFTCGHSKLSSAWRGKGKGKRGIEAQQVPLQPGGSPAIPTRPPAVHGNAWSLVRWEMVGSGDDFLRIFLGGGVCAWVGRGAPIQPSSSSLPGFS